MHWVTELKGRGRDMKEIIILQKSYVLSLMDGKGLWNNEFQNGGTSAPEYQNSLCRKRAMVA